ncbi:MAG: recombination protein RecR [Candidatus Kerfeldbacteria bacterium]|nr:recombination protein RecR [Candidatus Kerfeldbacteria bacterium]
MATYPPAIARLLDALTHLPGVGPKTAERYIFSLLRRSPAQLHELSQSIEHLRDKIVVCSRCHTFDEQNPCRYCSDRSRDQSTICVVTDAPDVLAIEHTGVYKGLYHVLGGTVSAMEGRGPDQLFIKDLITRVSAEQVSEIILAMNPDIEGETTTLYLKKALEGLTVKVTQLARGIPTGGDVTYVDEATLGEAIAHRQAA